MKTIKFLSHYEVKAVKGAKYKAGQVVKLPSASARHFVSRGVAEYAVKAKAERRPSGRDRRIKPDENHAPETDADLKHLGAGMYQLPDGTKVKGKKAAADIAAKMKVSKTVPEPDRAATAKRTYSDI